MLNLNCPDCGKTLIIQPSVSTGYKLVFCYAKVSKKDKNKRPIEVECGFRGHYNESTKKVMPAQLRLRRKE